jgi:hypothetical protein
VTKKQEAAGEERGVGVWKRSGRGLEEIWKRSAGSSGGQRGSWERLGAEVRD